MKQKFLFLSLKNKRDISKVFDTGEKIYSKNILMRYVYAKQRESLPLHILMALPKKKLGAVGRNRMRRICKSALFEAMKNVTQNDAALLACSYDVVIHARENFDSISQRERVEEFETLMTRLFKTGEN